MTLTLCEDADGKPTTKPIADGASSTIGAFSRGHDFRAFNFARPVAIEAGCRVWMVLTKIDEPAVVNPMFSIPVAIKDEKGPRDWYPAGDYADRGPYTQKDKPSAWRVKKGHDAYFRIVTRIE